MDSESLREHRQARSTTLRVCKLGVGRQGNGNKTSRVLTAARHGAAFAIMQGDCSFPIRLPVWLSRRCVEVHVVTADKPFFSLTEDAIWAVERLRSAETARNSDSMRQCRVQGICDTVAGCGLLMMNNNYPLYGL